MRRNSKLKFYFGLAAILFAAVQASAQCNRVGWVAASNPNCGVKILDLQTGELLWAVAGADNLVLGQTIGFAALPALGLPTCPASDNLPKISLTCVSKDLPCKAEFLADPEPLHPLTVRLSANLFDAANQSCEWDLGDGESGFGQQIVHTYPYEGSFKVKLRVSSKTCQNTSERNIFVSQETATGCGYDIAVTASGQTIFGEIFQSDSHTGDLASVHWYLSKTNQPLGDGPKFTFPTTEYGTFNVCAEYQVAGADGSTCTSTRCQRLSLDPPGCLNPAGPNAQILCPNWAIPVCGCNGLTYANECEAIAAGVTNWWSGSCGSPQPGNCTADLEAKVLGGSPADGFSVLFVNHAAGDFGNLQLDFGDGSPLHTALHWDTLSHQYANAGVYLANLTTWKNDGCISSVTRNIATDVASAANETAPKGSGYVLPGDANADGICNLKDLLYTGVGYFKQGVPRPGASTKFERQLAPNWPSNTLNGLNFKHMDCDGNGIVNELDPSVTSQHSRAMDTSGAVINPSLPKVRWTLKGNPDTIIIKENDPHAVILEADLWVAMPTQPTTDLHGIALSTQQPEFIRANPEFDYNDNSPFGSSNDVVWLRRFFGNSRQTDLAFTRKAGLGANGYMRLGTMRFEVDYIIIVDIIFRQGHPTSPFSPQIGDVFALDHLGLPKGLAVVENPDTVWLKFQGATGVHEAGLSAKIVVAPNPAREQTVIFTGDLDVQNILAFNELGQLVRQFEPSGERRTTLDLAGLAPGFYTLQIQTTSGLGLKKLVVW